MYRQPDVSGSAHPARLLNRQELAMLKAHYTTVRGCAGDEQRAKALSGWAERDKRCVVGLYERLRLHGFYVSGVGDDGCLQFACRLKSRIQHEMESRAAELEQSGRAMLAKHGLADVLKRIVRSGAE